jgi:hypothetical protein
LVLHPVTVPINDRRFSTVQKPIQHGSGQGAVVVEDSGPMFIRLVCGQHDGALLVTLADDLEEQVCAGLIDGQALEFWVISYLFCHPGGARAVCGGGDPAGLLHITDPTRLIDVAQKTVIGPSLISERPLLKLALSGSPEVERYIKAEKDFWSTLDDMRLKAYAKAWIPYGAEIQSIPGILHTELQEQNQALIKIAERTLDPTPLQTIGWQKIVELAKEKTVQIFQNLDPNLLPHPNSFLERV